LFAYPAPTKTPKKEAVTKVATVVLSTTAKIKAREKKKAAAEGDLDTVIIFIFRAELRPNLYQDEKPEAKKEVDVEMKSEESPSPTKHGDISTINGSLSNLAEDGKFLARNRRARPSPRQ
jgi:26S proteasome regulatory subunit N2